LDMRARRVARDEIGDHARQRFGLIAMRRMTAVRKHDDFGLRRARADAGDLRKRTVFVVLALRREYGALQPAERVHDRKAAEARVEPYVVPAEERRIGIVVIAGEPRLEVG